MYSAAITIAAILHIQQFLLVTALPDGAREGACSTLIPGHLRLPNQQPEPFPYVVTIPKIVDDEYIPGYNYTSKLSTYQKGF